MKITACLFVCCNALLVSANAQDKSKPTLKLGFSVGGNISSVSNSFPSASPVFGSFSGQHHRVKSGLSGGIALRYTLSDRFFARTRVLWKLHRAGTDVMGTDVEIKTDYEFSWIELPLDFNYVFNPQSRYKFYAGLGISAQRLMKSEATISTIVQMNRAQGSEFSLLDDMNRWNMSGLIHTGFILSSSTREIMIVDISAGKTLFNFYAEPKLQNNTFDFDVTRSEIRVNTLSLAMFIFIP